MRHREVRELIEELSRPVEGPPLVAVAEACEVAPEVAQEALARVRNRRRNRSAAAMLMATALCLAAWASGMLAAEKPVADTDGETLRAARIQH